MEKLHHVTLIVFIYFNNSYYNACQHCATEKPVIETHPIQNLK